MFHVPLNALVGVIYRDSKLPRDEMKGDSPLRHLAVCGLAASDTNDYTHGGLNKENV